MKYSTKTKLMLASLIAPMALLLSGCVVSSPVKTISDGKYQVTATANDGEHARFGATNQADQFCHKHHASSYKVVHMYTIDENFGKNLAAASAIANNPSSKDNSAAIANIKKNAEYKTTLTFKCH